MDQDDAVGSEDGMTNLESATTVELVTELARRHEAILLVTQQSSESVSEEADRTAISYYGGFNAALGMSRRAWRTLDKESDIEKDDEE